MEQVFIAGVGMTPLGRHLDKSVKQLTDQAVSAALADAGIERQSIQAAWFSNTRQGIMEGQHGIRGQVALRPLGFEGIPIINTDNACASSTTGVHMAFAYLRAGLADTVLVVGAEKMIYPDKRDLMFEAFKGSTDRESGEEQLAAALRLSADLPIPPEALTDGGQRSIFMDSYAAAARFHMLRFGSTQRQLAQVASKNHFHSTLNPMAHYRFPMSVAEVLADKPVAWPLTRSMCAPMTDGAGALVLCTAAAFRKGVCRRRAVPILASVLASGTRHDPYDKEAHIAYQSARKAYEQAGVGPQDISLAEVHDATAFGEIKHIEAMGFCGPGEGGAITESGATRLGGRVPVNPSGGLLSKGHPIAATGALQLHELVMQLRGEAGARQVHAARLAIAGNGGGNYEGEEAAMSTTILGAPLRH